MGEISYQLLIDWNQDGDFDDGGEDVTADIRDEAGIVCSRGHAQYRRSSPPAAGELRADLENDDKRYSPLNAAGPLYGNLYPGRTVRLRLSYAETPYDVWGGVLDRIVPRPERDRHCVEIPCLGPLSRLRAASEDLRISTALYQDIRTDQALGYILDAVGWPLGARVIDTGRTTLLWWWLQDEDPFEAAKAVVNTEGPGARLYEDGQGRIVFESRHYRLTTARCTSAQATFSDDGTEPGIQEAPFEYDDGQRDIVNVCTVETKLRSAKAAAVVWSYGQTLTLAPGEARSVMVSASDPFRNAVTPVAGTDYSLTAGSLASVVLDRNSGQSCTLTLTAGAAGATVAGLQVRAEAVSVDSTTRVSNTVDASASQARYGVRPYSLPLRAEIDPLVAQDFANAVVAQYQEPRPALLFGINSGHADRIAQILSREISDRVHVHEAETALDSDVFIERIEHRISQMGEMHETFFGCEMADDAGQFLIWDVGRWDVNQWGY